MSVQLAPLLAQGRKVNVGQMEEEEFEKILQVLQKDFELRQKEQERLSKIQEDLEEENKKATVLSQQTKLNENVCIRCCQTFGFIFNRKQTCQHCQLYICKKCCLYDPENKGYICHICAKDRELKLKSCEWFYDNVSKKFKRFGSAKVVRSLYKQKRRDSTRKYHTDNESDSGYDPSLLNSKTFGSLQSLDKLNRQLTDQNTGFDPVIPNPVQLGPSVKPPVGKSLNNNNQNESTNHGEKKEVSDIYKEAFENAKTSEEKKFHGRFDTLMVELRKSLEKLLADGVNSSYSNTSYGDVMMNYRGKLKDLLVSLSQRMEIVIESFDSNADDPLETSHKVRQLISKLVSENLGESLDLGTDEAVSDLSSLSEDSSDPVKSYEEQLAHAVVSKVLENHRRDHHLDFCLDELDGRKDEADQARNSSLSEDRSDRLYDSESLTSDNDKCDTIYSKSTAKNSQTQYVNQNKSPHHSSDISLQSDSYDPSHSPGFHTRPHSVNEIVQCDLSGNQRDRVERPRSVNETVQCQILDDHIAPERPRSVNEMTQCEFNDRIGLDRPVHVDGGTQCNDSIGLDRPTHVDGGTQYNVQQSVQDSALDIHEKAESVRSFSSSSTNVENEFEKLRTFAMDASSRTHPQSHQMEEYLDELPIEEEKIDRSESRDEFASRYDTFDRVHDDTRVNLPSLDDDYDYGFSEVDPDLLSMNLAPIMEEDEEEMEEEERSNDLERSNNNDDETEGGEWKGNWIFRSPAGITPYRNVGEPRKAEGLGQVYMTIPQPNKHMSPKIGHRDVDQISDLSDNTDKDEDNFSDEESSFYEHTSAEISRITKKQKHRSRTSSVQTDDSDIDDLRSRSRSRSVDCSTDESLTSKKKKLIEEYVPADGDDPKYEIPPESLEVPEGEPAKFHLRVAGTLPINVFWYKVEEDLVELMDSEQYETNRDGNRCYLTIYNPRRTDGGQYMAMAINEKGQCCQYMILSVKKNSQELKKPEFLKEIQDVDATEGQSVKFRCKVKGYPQPRICWYKDGKLLANDESYKIEKFGNRDYILTIDFASMNDDAEYTVVAKNIAGETKSVAQLIVDTDEVKPEEPIRKLPTQRREDHHLTNINRKMYETKENVANVAEEMLYTAEELTDIHKSLDEVDHILTSFEHDLHPTNTSDVTNNNWADTVLSHNLGHKTILNYQKMKTAAENVRKTTGKAFDLVESTDNFIDDNKSGCLATSTPRSSKESIHPPKLDHSLENKPKWLQFVKEDGDIPPEKLVSKVDNKDSYFTQPIKSSDSGYGPLSVDTSFNSVPKENTTNEQSVGARTSSSINSYQSNHVAVSDNILDCVTKPEAQTFETPLDSSNNFSDLNDNVLDSEPEIVNFGAKPVQAEFYSRDYIINNSASSEKSSKHWEVKTNAYSPTAEIVNRQKDLDNVEEKIYLSASRISHLESKIHSLEQEVERTPVGDKRKITDLEDDIAQTVAQTYRSEHDVNTIERSVEALQVSCPTSPRSADDDNMSSPSLSIDSGFSSIRDRPQPTTIIGSTVEDDLPESRTELNEETGVELPSVNRLKQLFGGEENTFQRSCGLDEPVSSITARSLGKDRVDKIRNLAKSVNQPSPLAAKSNQSSNQPSPLAAKSNQLVNQPSPLAAKTTNEDTPSKSQITVNLAPVSRTISHEPIPKQIFPKNKGEFYPSDQQKDAAITSKKTSRAPPTPCQSKQTTQAQEEKKKSGSRIRPGCINARAKFWEKKIQGDEPKMEEEFPSMVEHVQD